MTFSDETITINPDGTFSSPGSYYVNIAASVVQDVSGNAYSGFVDKTTWNFSTVDAVAPQVATLVPADDGTDIA